MNPLQKFLPMLLLLATISGMFCLGKWWPSLATAELRREQVPTVSKQPAQSTDYEAVLDKLPAAEFLVKWKALDAIPLADRDLTWPIKCGALWERWAVVDLAGALGALPAAPELPTQPVRAEEFVSTTMISFPSQPKQPGWVPDLPRHAVFAAWARSEPDAALTKAKALPAAERVAAMRGVMETLATTNPLRFLEEATTMGPIYSNFDRLQAFANLAKSDPSTAAAFIKQVPEGAFAAWDPRHGTYKDDAWQIVLKAWAKQDVSAAASYMETLTGNDFPLRTLIFKELVDADPARAAGWLPELNQDSRHHVSMLSFQQVSKLVPYVHDENQLRNLLFSAINRFPYCPAEQFPDAKRLFDALPAKDQSNTDKWMELLALWRKADPAGALQAILTRPDLRQQTDLLQDYVYPARYGEGGTLDEIRQRLEQVPEALRSGVTAAVVDRMTSHYRTSPASVRSLIGTMPAGKDRQTALGSYYRAGIERHENEQALASQLVAEPDSADLKYAYFIVAKGWANKRSLEASLWVKDLPAGITRDHAISGLVASIAAADPQAGSIWLAEIEDETTVTTTLRDATRSMKPEQKRAFLEPINHPAAQQMLRKLAPLP
jgi:hypothetical protein